MSFGKFLWIDTYLDIGKAKVWIMNWKCNVRNIIRTDHELKETGQFCFAILSGHIVRQLLGILHFSLNLSGWIAIIATYAWYIVPHRNTIKKFLRKYFEKFKKRIKVRKK